MWYSCQKNYKNNLNPKFCLCISIVLRINFKFTYIYNLYICTKFKTKKSQHQYLWKTSPLEEMFSLLHKQPLSSMARSHDFILVLDVSDTNP